MMFRPFIPPAVKNHIVSIDEWNNRCRWEHLTKFEQELVCDGGCGINVFGFKIVPDFIFKGPCCHHDFAWVRGGDERVRKITERAFYEDMQRLISSNDYKYYYNYWGTTYANATNHLGWTRWNYGKMKTKDEILEMAINNKSGLWEMKK